MKPKFKLAGEGQDSWIVDQHGRDIITVIKMGDAAHDSLLGTLMPIICDALNRREVKLQNPLHDVIFQMVLSGDSKTRCMARLLDLGDDGFNQRLIAAFPDYIEPCDRMAAVASKEKQARIEASSAS